MTTAQDFLSDKAWVAATQNAHKQFLQHGETELDSADLLALAEDAALELNSEDAKSIEWHSYGA